MISLSKVFGSAMKGTFPKPKTMPDLEGSDGYGSCEGVGVAAFHRRGSILSGGSQSHRRLIRVSIVCMAGLAAACICTSIAGLHPMQRRAELVGDLETLPDINGSEMAANASLPEYAPVLPVEDPSSISANATEALEKALNKDSVGVPT